MKCPGSLQPGTPAIGTYGRHDCSVCEARRFPRESDGLFPSHKYQAQAGRDTAANRAMN